jgi:DNA helicase-2/ATP-dependent DNA helicase PcrA
VQVAAHHPAPATFERWLRDVLARPDDPEGVTLSTVHRVKGMEWDRVAVFGVTAGVMPHRLATDEEEERRILHVAITRGRHRVAVLADARRPSPFLDELSGIAPHRPARRIAAKPNTMAPRAPARIDPSSPEGQETADALRAWRLERSRRDGVPAYVVLHDRTIGAIAAARPRNLAALRRIDGIGPAKLERYGEEILDVLAGLSREEQ